MALVIVLGVVMIGPLLLEALERRMRIGKHRRIGRTR
jgi:hypothetical protein